MSADPARLRAELALAGSTLPTAEARRDPNGWSDRSYGALDRPGAQPYASPWEKRFH